MGETVQYSFYSYYSEIECLYSVYLEKLSVPNSIW